MHWGMNSSIFFGLFTSFIIFNVNFVVMFSRHNLLSCDVRMSLFLCVLCTKFQDLHVIFEGD